MGNSITLKPLKHFGRVDYLPRCDLSKVLCEILHSKGLGIKTVDMLTKHKVKVFYSADENDETLDGLGAIKK